MLPFKKCTNERNITEELHNAICKWTSLQPCESKSHTTDGARARTQAAAAAAGGEEKAVPSVEKLQEKTNKTKGTCDKCHKVVCGSCTWKVEITFVDCELLIHKCQWNWCVVFVLKTTWCLVQVSPLRGEYFHHGFSLWYFCLLKQILLSKPVCFPTV